MEIKKYSSIRYMVMILCIAISFGMTGTASFASSSDSGGKIIDYTTICDKEQVLKDQNTMDVDPEIVIKTRGLSRTRTTWDTIRQETDKGNILITKDDNTPVIDHGHSALVYSAGSQTVEIFGAGYTSGIFDFEDTTWGDKNRVRLYYPASATYNERKNAANYAANNLLDMEYAMLASIGSSEELNCATLVWRSYNHVGTMLGYMFKDNKQITCIPQALVEGPGNMTIKIQKNWSGDNW